MEMVASVRRHAWLLLVLCTALADAQEVLPIDYFTRSDDIGSMKLSPDGEFIAITAGQHGAGMLTFFSLEEQKVVSGVRAPDGMEIDDFHWASNQRVVFMIAERQPGQVRPTPTGEIFAVDRDGSKQTRIYGYRAGESSTGTHQRVRKASYATAHIVSLLDDDDRYILISEMPWRLSGNTYYYNRDARPRLTRLDTYSGLEKNVGSVPLAGADVVVDRDDVPRFAIGRSDAGDLAVAWRRKEESKDWEEFLLPGFREGTVQPLQFTPDNAAVLFVGVPERQQYRALFRLTLADHSVKQVIEIPDTDVRGIVSDFQGQEAIGVHGYTDKLVYRWVLPEHPAARLHQSLHRAFPGNQVRFTSQSADGARAIVFVDSDVAPGEYLLFDTQTKKAQMLRAARKWVNLHKMRPKESIELTARDGMSLHGYLTRPMGEGPHPLVVLPHGGPHGVRDRWSYDSEVQLLANRGYAVLQLNFRGSGGYGMGFEHAGYREWGRKMQDDLTDATRWAIDQKVTTADRICIFGASYGGYAALMGAAREPTLYRCAIGYAGVYDLPLMYESGDIPESRAGMGYLERVLGTNQSDLQARSPVSLAGAIEAPVLLIHGKEDWRVDYKQATSMKAALEKAGKRVEWLSLSREGHGVYDDQTRLKMYESILEFLDEHLSVPGGETGGTPQRLE